MNLTRTGRKELSTKEYVFHRHLRTQNKNTHVTL